MGPASRIAAFSTANTAPVTPAMRMDTGGTYSSVGNKVGTEQSKTGFATNTGLSMKAGMTGMSGGMLDDFKVK